MTITLGTLESKFGRILGEPTHRHPVLLRLSLPRRPAVRRPARPASGMSGFGIRQVVSLVSTAILILGPWRPIRIRTSFLGDNRSSVQMIGVTPRDTIIVC